MTENGDPLENAIAERVNGIIKGEYLFDYEIKTLSKAKEILKSVVKLYNEDRPHSSIGNAAPSQVHNNADNSNEDNVTSTTETISRDHHARYT